MEVKICDFQSPNFSKDFKHSAVSTGFAVVTNHGIDKQAIEECQRLWRRFFLQSQYRKDAFLNEENPNMGYMGLKKETAVGSKLPDLKEFFHWKMGEFLPNPLVDPTMIIHSHLQVIADNILSILDEDGKYTSWCRDSDSTILRAIYYPAMDFAEEQGAVRAAAHEDINFITLLVAASSPGLQVLDKEGNWHAVPHEENSIVVNIGDMLQLASNGLYRSTTHRVVNPENNTSDRISLPLFIHPHSDTQLTPDKTAKQYLDERLDQIYGIGRKK